MTDLDALAEQWQKAKAAETEAVESRRLIEDQISAALAIDNASEATTTAKTGAYQIKVSTRLTRKVDADKIQEAASEAGISHLLATVCRWKPELDLRVWKGLSEDNRKALAPAITTTAGRPSYSLTDITKE